MQLEEFDNVEETLINLRASIDHATTGVELRDDPYRRVQYKALAQQITGAIAMVHVIEDTDRRSS